MAYTPMRIYQGVPGTGTAAELFQIDATGLFYTTGVIIKQILLINRTTSGATVTLHLVPDPGTTIADGNIIVPGITVPANSLITLDTSIVMRTNDAIFGTQGTSTAINVSVHGVGF